MAKIFDKMKDLMFGEYEDDEDDYYEEEYSAPVREVSASTYATREVPRQNDYVSQVPQKKVTRTTTSSSPNVYSINTSVQMQVVIMKPQTYDDAQEICDQIKTKRPVVVNLENVEFPIAQRIMDFLSGVSYSLDGSIQRVAHNIFLIAPENVEISGDFKEELKSKGALMPWMTGSR